MPPFGLHVLGGRESWFTIHHTCWVFCQELRKDPTKTFLFIILPRWEKKDASSLFLSESFSSLSSLSVVSLFNLSVIDQLMWSNCVGSCTRMGWSTGFGLLFASFMTETD